MKRIIAALFAVALLGTTVENAHAIGVYGTWWNMNDANDDGFGFGIRQPIKIVPIFSIDTRAAYVNFSDGNVYPLEAVAIVSFGLVYGGVGVGYYIFDVDAAELVVPAGPSNVNADIKDSFGWHVLAGVNVGLSKLSVFGEVKWTQLEADYKNIDPNFNDVPTSLDAAGMGFNIGVLLGI